MNNEDYENGRAVKELNKLVGLKDQDKIDSKAIAEVQYSRVDQMEAKWSILIYIQFIKI